MTAPMRVCVAGAAGRMGRRLLRLIREDAAFSLAAALEQPGVLAADGGVSLVYDPVQALAGADVVVDFAVPATCATLAPLCAQRRLPYLVASTGLTPEDEAALARAAAAVPVLSAPNLSVGVNALLELVRCAAEQLGEAFDIEIVEVHHRHKRDAPSGTALALGRAAESGRGPLTKILGRAGTGGPRPPDELGVAALRGGDVTGDHTVYFLGAGERLELTHRATTPDVFARGALRAAAWLAGRAPGRYSMRDVLGG